MNRGSARNLHEKCDWPPIYSRVHKNRGLRFGPRRNSRNDLSSFPVMFPLLDYVRVSCPEFQLRPEDLWETWLLSAEPEVGTDFLCWTDLDVDLI